MLVELLISVDTDRIEVSLIRMPVCTLTPSSDVAHPVTAAIASSVAGDLIVIPFALTGMIKGL